MTEGEDGLLVVSIQPRGKADRLDARLLEAAIARFLNRRGVRCEAKDFQSGIVGLMEMADDYDTLLLPPKVIIEIK